MNIDRQSSSIYVFIAFSAGDKSLNHAIRDNKWVDLFPDPAGGYLEACRIEVEKLFSVKIKLQSVAKCPKLFRFVMVRGSRKAGFSAQRLQTPFMVKIECLPAGERFIVQQSSQP